MKMKSIEKVLLSLILFSIIGFTFITSGNLFQREATIITLLICIFLFWSYLRSNFFDEINDFEFILNKVNYSILFGAIFIINLLFQNAYLNFETIDWDISSYLVVSNEINQGYLPLERQWESKPPLLFYTYNFFTTLSGNNYLIFRILNDFIVYFLSIILFMISKKNFGNTKSVSFLISITYIIFMSAVWNTLEYSELYSLLFLSLSFYIYTNKTSKNSPYLAGIFLGLSILCNQGTLIFLLGFVFSLIFKNSDEVDNKLIFLGKFIFGIAIPNLVFVFYYYSNNLFDIYFAHFFSIPLSYASEGFNFLGGLIDYLRSFYKFNAALYSLFIFIIISVSIQFLNNRIKNKENISYSIDDISIFIIFSIIFFYVGSHGYYHHLLFLMFFLPLLIMKISTKVQKNLFILFLISALISTGITQFPSSINNLKDLDTTFKNYPLRALSVEIDSYFDDEDYTILAFDYNLVLFYLDKHNQSYIVHSENYLEEYIVNELIEVNYMSENEINDLLDQEADVVICSPRMIKNGVVTKNELINCEISDYKKNYKKIDTSVFIKNENLQYYRDPYKEISLFIKQDE